MRPGDTGVKRRVTVGHVLKPVGLKGEIKIVPMSDNPDRFAPGGKLWMVGAGGEARSFIVERVSEHKGNLRLKLGGIDSVEEADGYRGREVFVHEDEVPPLPEGEYYHFQILGLPVYTASEKLLGKVADIFTAGEKDVYVVKGRGREYLVPVNGQTVDVIDVAAGRIRLFRMPGYIPDDPESGPDEEMDAV
ncbi:MAG: 16S rRNA processing protein RimM [Nitrospirae bacterium]|nr:16S rRNA processing protein RimM [Nitrospirota bacterium]